MLGRENVEETTTNRWLMMLVLGDRAEREEIVLRILVVANKRENKGTWA